MKFEDIMNSINNKNNGAWFNCTWKKDLPLTAKAKKEGNEVYKITVAQCRKGIKYSNQKAVKEKVENGKVLTHNLPWGVWKKGFEGLFIEHKNNTYLRMYFGPNAPVTKYFVNGKETTLSDLKNSGFIVNSFFNKKDEKPDAFTVNIENIINI